MAFPIPHNEQGRLAALRELQIVDTEPEAVYDDVVALAAAICRTPIAMINFVDADRQSTKAMVGGEPSVVPRETSFCARVIMREDRLLVIPDLLDSEWVDNPLVVGDPNLRFYAGAAIVSEDGHGLGTVCVADQAPREFGDDERQALLILARQTASHLELRRRSRELVAANGELRRMAIEDGLTGLANRTLLLDRLAHALLQRRRTPGMLGLLFCDLDGFKAVNDEHGHEVGDDVLREVAKRMVAVSRVTDTVARLAGDEFVVLCSDLSGTHDLEMIVQRLGNAVSQPYTDQNLRTSLRMSIGGVIATADDDPDGILRRADAAMYVAKQQRSTLSPLPR